MMWRTFHAYSPRAMLRTGCHIAGMTDFLVLSQTVMVALIKNMALWRSLNTWDASAVERYNYRLCCILWEQPVVQHHMALHRWDPCYRMP